MRSLNLKSLAAIAAVLFAANGVANAGNTNFLTERNAAITFPFSPPNKATGGPGSIDNTVIGATTPKAGKFSQVLPSGGVPTIASGDCGTTTNGAVVAGSTNQAGSITIGAVATTTCKITFAAGLTAAFKACVFFPMNAAGGATGTTVARVGAPTLTDVTLSGSALANANYAFVCM